MPDYLKYQKSIADELLAVSNRVRDFIGTAHWGEDGRYKEIIFADVLRRALPKVAEVGTGFVIGNANQITKQIDVLVYDNRFPLLFQKDNFIIAPQESVLAIIEVKSKITGGIIRDTVESAHNNGRIIGAHIFNGIFGFETDISFGNQLSRPVHSALSQNQGYVNNIAFGKDHFMKYWPANMPYQHQTNAHYSFYRINDLSFGYFISNLVEDIHIRLNGREINDTLKRYLYPIEETKEAHRLDGLDIKIPITE